MSQQTVEPKDLFYDKREEITTVIAIVPKVKSLSVVAKVFRGTCHFCVYNMKTKRRKLFKHDELGLACDFYNKIS